MAPMLEENLELYLSLFRGRKDVYARRWERNGKFGYSPAYEVNWDEFNKFKASGGSFKDFAEKKPLPFTAAVAQQHLLGYQCVGVYPILPDNTSYFIAADFDGPNWLVECQSVIEQCALVGLSAYLERSRSGNGGHVWVFFKDAYPCSKSRHIFLELVRRALKLSEFDKEVSFDRLFPSQNYIGKDGFGNLIALPFQGVRVKQQNTVFINPTSGTPYEDQWEFLQSVHRHTAEELDATSARLFSSVVTSANRSIGNLAITLNSSLTLNKSEPSSEIISFLKEHLNFMNTDYLTKRKLGKSVYKVQKYFKLIEEVDEQILLPRGFLS